MAEQNFTKYFIFFITTGVVFENWSCIKSHSTDVICDGKRQWKFELIDSIIFTCMVFRSEIDKKGFVFKTVKDEHVHGINFSNNSKVLFLPEDLHEKFPSLLMYEARNCKVRSLNKLNFEKLTKLTAVDLSYNFIAHIPKDLFEDSLGIHVINFKNNNIISIEVAVFLNMNFLSEVYLRGNICTNEDFLTEFEISSIANKLIGSCQIDERVKRIFNTIDRRILIHPVNAFLSLLGGLIVLIIILAIVLCMVMSYRRSCARRNSSHHHRQREF